MTLSLKAFILQINTNTSTDTIIQYTEVVLEFILISMSIITLLITPVALFYFAYINYFKWKKSKKIIAKKLSSKNENIHSSYALKILKIYRMSFIKFISNTSGLLAWNIFSIVYIFTSFTNFKTGLYEYFLFPFNVLETYSSSFTLYSLSEFKMQGLSMFIIFVLSLIFFLFGKSLALFLLKKNFSISINDKLKTSINSDIKTNTSIEFI